VVGLKATHILAEVVRELKVASAKWVHAEVKMTVFRGRRVTGVYGESFGV
jgi:hypothetical protein